jgi:fluoride ion exporter CrcB/FEX
MSTYFLVALGKAIGSVARVWFSELGSSLAEWAAACP